MSLGDRLRGLIDPLDPTVRTWLQRELPRLVKDGYIDVAQADLIARRYGVTVTAADIAAATAPAAQPPSATSADAAAVPPPMSTSASAPASESDPVIGVIGAGASGPVPAAGPDIGEWTTAGTQVPPPGAPSTAHAAGGPAGLAPGGLPVPAGRPATPFVGDSAVSIVLYLGAFLVVAAVIIFLAYSWGDMSGGARLTVLAVLTGGFLAAAAVCLPRPSVRPAGRTFLALGAILVPANIAAVYLVYFWDSPIPPAVFWLLGALISGVLHAALSVRLRSYGYAVLAVPSIPVAASALGWLITPHWEWIGTSAALALALTLAAARNAPPIPLVQTARGVGSMLLVLAYLVTLPAYLERSANHLSPSVALALMSAGLAWDATRRGKTWWFGAAATLLAGLVNTVALQQNVQHPAFVPSIMLATLIGAAAAYRLSGSERLLWACAVLLTAALYPLAAWDRDQSASVLFVNVIVLATGLAWIYRSPWPLLLSVLAVDGAYLKVLDIYSTRTSPPWTLGVALWPLAIIWVVIGTFVPRRWSGPAWLGALVTMIAAAGITWQEPRWSLAVTSSAAIATIIAAWRLRAAIIVPLAGIPLIAAAFQGAGLLEVPILWRYVTIGVSGWLLFAVSFAHRSAHPSAEIETTQASSAAASPPTDASTAPAADPGSEPPAATAAPSTRATRRLTALPAFTLYPVDDWALMSRFGAIFVAGISILLLFAAFDDNDRWFEASTAGWVNVVVLFATWSLLSRSWLVALGAALSVVPALFFGILRLHPPDTQFLAVPIALYLLAVGTVARRREQHQLGTVIAAAGLVVLLAATIWLSLEPRRVLLHQAGSWLIVVAFLAIWAYLWRSWLLALFSALTVVLAVDNTFRWLALPDMQFEALTIGLYLLAVATVARLRGQPLIGSIAAGVGLLVMLGTSIAQSFDRDGARYALLALTEGLVFVGVGIAVRWRVLVIGGVAGTVLIVFRQLVDVVTELPWWAILGGSGILLLGTAVALLLIRAKLAAAGRAVADRWSQWD